MYNFTVSAMHRIEDLRYSLNIRVLIKLVQLERFSEEISTLQKSGKLDSSSRLFCLNPFLDQNTEY